MKQNYRTHWLLLALALCSGELTAAPRAVQVAETPAKESVLKKLGSAMSFKRKPAPAATPDNSNKTVKVVPKVPKALPAARAKASLLSRVTDRVMDTVRRKEAAPAPTIAKSSPPSKKRMGPPKAYAASPAPAAVVPESDRKPSLLSRIAGKSGSADGQKSTGNVFTRMVGRESKPREDATHTLHVLPPSIPGQSSLMAQLTGKKDAPALAKAKTAKPGWMNRLTQPVGSGSDDEPSHQTASARKPRPTNWKQLSVVKEEGLKFYEFGPSQSQGADMKLARGTALKVRKVTRGYALVEMPNGRTGYVDASLLKAASTQDFHDARRRPLQVAGGAGGAGRAPRYYASAGGKRASTPSQLARAQAEAASWVPGAGSPDLPEIPLPSGTDMDEALLLLPPLDGAVAQTRSEKVEEALSQTVTDLAPEPTELEAPPESAGAAAGSAASPSAAVPTASDSVPPTPAAATESAAPVTPSVSHAAQTEVPPPPTR